MIWSDAAIVGAVADVAPGGAVSALLDAPLVSEGAAGTKGPAILSCETAPEESTADDRELPWVPGCNKEKPVTARWNACLSGTISHGWFCRYLVG